MIAPITPGAIMLLFGVGATCLSLLVVMILLAVQAAAAGSDPGSSYPFATIFGPASNPDGSLLVADAGAGVVQIKNGKAALIPGEARVIPLP